LFEAGDTTVLFFGTGKHPGKVKVSSGGRPCAMFLCILPETWRRFVKVCLDREVPVQASPTTCPTEAKTPQPKLPIIAVFVNQTKKSQTEVSW